MGEKISLVIGQVTGTEAGVASQLNIGESVTLNQPDAGIQIKATVIKTPTKPEEIK